MTEEMASNAPKGALRWYVIQAFSGYEQRVAECLQQQIELQGMKDYFGEVLVPKEKVKEIRDGKKVDKKHVSLPEKIVNIVKCKNPRCITSTEQELDQVFRLTDPEKRVYRCMYCDSSNNFLP